MSTNNENGNGFIKAMVATRPNSGPEKKSWGIGVENVLVPFFTATNAMGETDVSPDALGAPVRLATNKDGTVRYSNNGRPSTRVAPEITNQVKLMRENFIGSLMDYTGQVVEDNPEAYQAAVLRNQQAGQPILEADTRLLQEDVDRQMEEERRTAAAVAEPCEPETAEEQPTRVRRAKGKADDETPTETANTPDRELVTAAD